MIDKYKHFIEHLESRFDANFDLAMHQFQGKEITKKDFVECYSIIVLLSCKLLEQIASFLMMDNDFVITDENYLITDFTKKGENLFYQQMLATETKDQFFNRRIVSPIRLLSECAQYIIRESEIAAYFNLLRHIRNILVHTQTTDDEGVNTITKFLDSFFILLLWLINTYLQNTIDDSTKERISNKIYRAKFSLQIISDRTINPTKNSSTQYVVYLENRVRELESELAEAKKQISNNIQYITNILSDIKQDVSDLKVGQETVIKKLDDLSDFILQNKKDIEEQLNKAINNSNEEVVEKIIEDFSNKVIKELMEKLDSGASYYYDEEEAVLKTVFTEELWNKLERNSRSYLITGKVLFRQMNNSNKEDYSGICLLITKAVENELHRYFYNKFKKYLLNLYPYPDNKDQWPSFFIKTNYYGEVIIGSHDFTLGSVKYFCCKGKTFKQFDKDVLLDYCTDELFKSGIPLREIENNLQFITDSVEKIRNDYRNPAAHVAAVDGIKAKDCLDYIVDTTKILKEYMALFK